MANLHGKSSVLGLFRAHTQTPQFMPIRRFLGGHKSTAKPSVWWVLPLRRRWPRSATSPTGTTQFVRRWRGVFALAQAGERDPDRLCDGALRAVSPADPTGGRDLAEGGQATES
jgi:hypothetical protein